MPTILTMLQGIYEPHEPYGRYQLQLGWEFDGPVLYGDMPARSPLPYALTELGQEVYAALSSIRGLNVYLPDYARRLNGLVGTWLLAPEPDGRFAPPLGRLMRHVADNLAQCQLDPTLELAYKIHDGVFWAQQGHDLGRDAWPTAPKRLAI